MSFSALSGAKRHLSVSLGIVGFAAGLAFPATAAGSRTVHQTPRAAARRSLRSADLQHPSSRPTARSRFLPAKKGSRLRRSRVRRKPAQRAPTPDRIQEIQSALARSGYYRGEPTGRWEAKTIEAMKRFQQASGLTPTGKLDAPSLQKLGLGSDIAGVGAPRPATPPAEPFPQVSKPRLP